MTRGFHGSDVKEGHWERMFDRRLPAVVPMDYKYLAQYDGSEMALGRGSGLDTDGDGRERRKQKTPYMHMTFFPLERRLDTAIWRALFASSTKQARQFCVHGAVKVNGKKMVHPTYKLNPGDMFSVDPDMVLFATGAKKRRKGSSLSDQEVRDQEAEKKRIEQQQEQDLEEEASDAGAATLKSDEELEAMSTQPEDEEDPKKALRNLMIRAQRVLDDSKRKLSAKGKQELREFSRTVKKTMSKLRGIDEDKVEDTVEGLEVALAEIFTKIQPEDLRRDERLDTAAAAEAAQAAEQAEQQENDGNINQYTSSNRQMQQPGKIDHYRAKKDAETLRAAIALANENPIDSDKPYATPWKPREFMSAFAFIPRYLEVNHKICSAVYLRHPVARPGLGEVPTPFHGETMGLAFNWYLRRR
jgi:ribosomal protein S4